jgi:hypothetical protein
MLLVGGMLAATPTQANASFICHFLPNLPICLPVVPPPPPPAPTPATHTVNETNSAFPRGAFMCVMGSAAGLIGASIVKARALGFQYRWLSQVEYERHQMDRDPTIELTSNEAALIGFTCGVGAVPVLARYSR